MLPRALRALLLLAGATALAVVPVAGAASGAATVAPVTADGACAPVTVMQSTKAAMAVFTGTVTAVQRTDKSNGERGAYFDYTVTATRVYQGKIDTASVAVRSDKTPRECSLEKLAVGATYMFFVIGDGNPWIAAGEGGTQPASDQVVAQVVRFLGDGRDAVKPEPEKAVFTPVHPADPQPLTRAAAPGAALVLIGLLGLGLVRGLRRRPG